MAEASEDADGDNEDEDLSTRNHVDIDGGEWGEPFDLFLAEQETEDEAPTEQHTPSTDEAKRQGRSSSGVGEGSPKRTGRSTKKNEHDGSSDSEEWTPSRVKGATGKRKRSSAASSGDESTPTKKRKSPPKKKTKSTPKKGHGSKSEESSDDADDLLYRVCNAKIALPSSFKQSVRDHPALAVAISIERRMWERYANFNLDQVRAHLITAFGAAAVKKMIHNQNLSTRSHNAIKYKWRLVYTAANIYRQARRNLLLLGMPPDDQHLRELKPTDLRAFTAFTVEEELVTREERQQKKGKKKKKRASWIWEKWDFIEKGDNPKLRKYFLEGTRDLTQLEMC